jgi:hypothetical protein
MGKFISDNLPSPQDFYENNAGLKLVGRGEWRTTRCEFHRGSDSMRINLKSGGFICMNCQVKGGDVLAYQMQTSGQDFVDAAKALGAWDDGGIATRPEKATPLSARAALQVLASESNFTAVAAANVGHGIALSESEKDRLLVAARRINQVAELFP